jgi:type II secretory pathway pseudopilin PulG
MRAIRTRRGFTLIDLIAVLGIVLFLLAVLAPFVFRLRRAATDSQSANNLHHIGIAVHSYDEAYGRLPPIVGKAKDEPGGSILFHLLPFVEEKALYRKGPVWEAGTAGQVIPVFLHPGDKTAPPRNKFEDWLATCNYAGNWLVFSRNLNIAKISAADGVSNTIFFAERYQVCNGQPCGWGYDRLYYWAPVFAYYSSEKFQHQPAPEECNPALPQSLSAGGIQVLLGDASVRTVAPEISPSTWRAVLTPDAGEPLGLDWAE